MARVTGHSSPVACKHGISANKLLNLRKFKCDESLGALYAGE